MKNPSEDDIIHSMCEYLKEKGHGAITVLAKESNLSPETIRRVRDKKNIPDLATIKSIQAALDSFGFEIIQKPPIDFEMTIDTDGDAVYESVNILKNTVSIVENMTKSRGKRARIILDFLEIIERHFADELREIGLED